MRTHYLKWAGGVAVVVAITITYLHVSYHGPFEFPDTTNKEIDCKEVVAAARDLCGVLYDPLQGKLGNLGAKLGFIVCMDVPVIAFGTAGYSIKQALLDDYGPHQLNYDTAGWNIPQNPYFHRRVRNLYAYCLGNNCLIQASGQPMPGDLVFLKKPQQRYPSHVALVSQVQKDGEYWVVEAESRAVLTREVIWTSLQNRGWVVVDFGRLPACRTSQSNTLPISLLGLQSQLTNDQQEQ